MSDKIEPVAWMVEEDSYPQSRTYSLSVILGKKPNDCYDPKPLYTAAALDKARDEALEEALASCKGIATTFALASDYWKVQAAEQCAAAIRALKNRQGLVAASSNPTPAPEPVTGTYKAKK